MQRTNTEVTQEEIIVRARDMESGVPSDEILYGPTVIIEPATTKPSITSRIIKAIRPTKRAAKKPIAKTKTVAPKRRSSTKTKVVQKKKSRPKVFLPYKYSNYHGYIVPEGVDGRFGRTP